MTMTTMMQGTIPITRNKRSRTMMPAPASTGDSRKRFAAKALLVLSLALVGTIFLDASSTGTYLRSAGNSRSDGRNIGGRKLSLESGGNSNAPEEESGEEGGRFLTRAGGRKAAFYSGWGAYGSEGSKGKVVKFQDHADVIHAYVPSVSHEEGKTGQIQFPSEETNAEEEETARRNQQDMLEAWRKVWEERGWRVRYVTDDEARNSADFDANAWDELLQKSEQLPERKRNAARYLYLQYLRFLAMSAAGGGYLSDVDVAPLTQPHPIAHKDRFTIYTWSNGLTPNLVSASNEEYDRVAADLLRRAQSYAESESDEREGIEIWRDMVMEETNSDKFYRMNDAVACTDDIMAANGEGGRDLTSAECGHGGELKAVHFGAKALEAGGAAVMREWADRFDAFCDDIRKKEGQLQQHQQQQEGDNVVDDTPPVGDEKAEEVEGGPEEDGGEKEKAMSVAESYRMRTASIATEMLANFRQK